MWGDDVKKKEYEVIVSPRSRYGQATLPEEVRVDSGGYPAGTAPGLSAVGVATSTTAGGVSGVTLRLLSAKKWRTSTSELRSTSSTEASL